MPAMPPHIFSVVVAAPPELKAPPEVGVGSPLLAEPPTATLIGALGGGAGSSAGVCGAHAKSRVHSSRDAELGCMARHLLGLAGSVERPKCPDFPGSAGLCCDFGLLHPTCSVEKRCC